MRKPRVLCAADLSVSPETKGLLERETDLFLVPPTSDAVIEQIAGCHAYFASLKVRFDRETFERADVLRVIATPTTGTDHIDLEEGAKRGIAVLSLKDETEFLSGITSTAELAWGLLVSVVRRIPACHDHVLSGGWNREEYIGRQLAGKTLGILGYGRLGRMMGDYGRAFRMRLLACDIKAFDEPGVERVDFDTLLAECDILSIHVHLTDDTRGLISHSAFERMKPGAVLVNTSRGAIVDEAALLDALETGKLAGAGLDVLEHELDGDTGENPLVRYAREHDNVVITPHVGGATYEALDTTLQFMARRLIEFLHNRM